MDIGSLKSIKELGLAPILAFLNVFLYINAGAFVGPESGMTVVEFKEIILSYIILIAVVGSFKAFSEPEFPKEGLNQSMFYFTAAFAATALILTGWKALPNFGVLAVGGSTINIIIQGSTVAFSETYVFQGSLPSFFGKGWLAAIVAQVFFAVFHLYAYNLSIGLMFIAFVAGIIFYGIAKLTGNLYAAAGVHMAYNLVILGVI